MINFINCFYLSQGLEKLTMQVVPVVPVVPVVQVVPVILPQLEDFTVKKRTMKRKHERIPDQVSNRKI